MKQSDSGVDELVLLAKQGGEQAYDAVLKMFKELVRNKARLFYLSGGDSDDLIQEGMIGLYKAVRDYEPGRSSFGAFAAMCIERQLSTAVRRSLRDKNRPLNGYISFGFKSAEEDGGGEVIERLASDSQNPEAIYIDNEDARATLEMIERKLSGFEQRVLRPYIAGKTYDEIATSLSIDSKAVDNAVQRIKRKARLLL